MVADRGKAYVAFKAVGLRPPKRVVEVFEE